MPPAHRLTFALIVLAALTRTSDGEDCPLHAANTSLHRQFSEPLRNRAVVCAGAVSTMECAMQGGKFVFCNASNVYTDPKTRAFVMYCSPTALFKDAARWRTLGKYSPLAFIDIRPPQQAVRPVQATADTTLFVSRADCSAPFNPGHCLADIVNTFGVRTAYGVTRASASSLVFTGCRGMEPTSPVFLNYEALARHAHIGHRCLGGTPTTPLFGGVTHLPQVVFGANPWWSVVWRPLYPVSAKLRFDRVCGRWVGERCRYPDELLMAFQREVMRRVDGFQPALDLRGVPTALTHNLDQPTATPPEGLIVLIDRSSHLMDGTKTPTTGCRRCIVDVEDVWRELVATFGSRRPLVAIDFKGLPYALQLRVMSFADTVVGVHGAAVSHVVYMRPNSTLIELLPTDAESRNQNLKMHYEIAASLGVNYRAVQVPGMKWKHGGAVGGARVVEAMRRAWRADGCASAQPMEMEGWGASAGGFSAPAGGFSAPAGPSARGWRPREMVAGEGGGRGWRPPRYLPERMRRASRRGWRPPRYLPERMRRASLRAAEGRAAGRAALERAKGRAAAVRARLRRRLEA